MDNIDKLPPIVDTIPEFKAVLEMLDYQIHHYNYLKNHWFTRNKKTSRIHGTTCKKISNEYWIIWKTLKGERTSYMIWNKGVTTNNELKEYITNLMEEEYKNYENKKSNF